MIHIQHMSAEIGIMLMLAISALWYREMTVTMTIGILAIIVNHLLIGSHWPLRRWAPSWKPKNMKPLLDAGGCIFMTVLLLSVGFYTLSLN